MVTISRTVWSGLPPDRLGDGGAQPLQRRFRTGDLNRGRIARHRITS
jgi:hypothetical protein